MCSANYPASFNILSFREIVLWLYRMLGRYYEIKLTAVDTVVTEETIYISQPNGTQQANSQGSVTEEVNGNGDTSNSDAENGHAGNRDTKQYEEEEVTEEVTSVSHEESVKFTIRAIIDPRNGKEITIEQVRDVSMYLLKVFCMLV
jgi:hypothetical protein